MNVIEELLSNPHVPSPSLQKYIDDIKDEILTEHIINRIINTLAEAGF